MKQKNEEWVCALEMNGLGFISCMGMDMDLKPCGQNSNRKDPKNVENE